MGGQLASGSVAFTLVIGALGCGRIGFDAHGGGNDGGVVTPFGPPVLDWSRLIGGAADPNLTSVAGMGPRGVVAGGAASGPVDLGGGLLPWVGESDAVIASYDVTGAHRWSRSFGSPADDSISGVAVDAAGTKHSDIARQVVVHAGAATINGRPARYAIAQVPGGRSKASSVLVGWSSPASRPTSKRHRGSGSTPS